MKNFEIELYNALKPLYAKLLENVSDSHDLPICTFCVQWGKRWIKNSQGIAFYGRATNGWISDSTDVNELFNGEESIFNRKDQMQWIEDCWNNDTGSGYKCGKSAFWRVIKRVSETFYPQEWSSNIVWSDVCKVAPWNGGNPSDSLYYAQLSSAQQIMKAEIEILDPKHIVLFTGYNWAVDFLNYLNNGDVICEEQVPWDGYEVKVYHIEGRYYYLTEHPQGKVESDHAEALIQLIKKHF